MLSVDRTEEYLTELDMPVEESVFPEVMRFARGCLEVFMFPSISRRKGKPESRALTKSWRLYRTNEGVLTEDLLKRLSAPAENLGPKDWSTYVTSDIFEKLQDRIGVNRAQTLKDWFERNYLPTRSGFQIWYLVIWRLLKEQSEKSGSTLPPAISHRQLRFMKIFCDRFEKKRSSLLEQFRVIERIAVPTRWEAVLQTFPVDSCAGNYFPWLDYGVKPCLILKVFRTEWSELKARLGPRVLAEVENTVITRFGQDLPDESIIMGETSTQRNQN